MYTDTLVESFNRPIIIIIIIIIIVVYFNNNLQKYTVLDPNRRNAASIEMETIQQIRLEYSIGTYYFADNSVPQQDDFSAHALRKVGQNFVKNQY